MSLLRRSGYAVAILVAIGAIAGCANQTSPVPFASSLTQNAANSGALLYVSDVASGNVSFYSYPGLAFKGEISGLKDPGPLCTDPRNGDVWVISGVNTYKFTEFKHGAIHPIRTFKFTPFDELLPGCAVSPTNGDLAVTEHTEYDDAGVLLVFPDGSSKPISYESRNMFFYEFVIYDAAGDAFVDGANGGTGALLDELPSGRAKFQNAKPHHWMLHAPFEGGVQYDGTNVVVGELRHGRLYRISNRRVVGTTQLFGTCFVRQFAIDGNALIAPSACDSHGEVLLYKYPAGGNPITKLTGFQAPYAVTISQ